jgi:hypothetical protein
MEPRHQIAFNGLDFDDLMFEKEYDPWKVIPTPETHPAGLAPGISC